MRGSLSSRRGIPPLTLTAVLFAIVRAHRAAVMPAVSQDTASLGRTEVSPPDGTVSCASLNSKDAGGSPITDPSTERR